MRLSQVSTCTLITLAVTGLFTSIMVQTVGQGGHGLPGDMNRNRIVAQAMLQYVADNGGRFPQTNYTLTYDVTSNPPDNVWPRLILPYHANMENYRDPENPQTFSDLMWQLPDCTNNPVQCLNNLGIKSNRGYNFQYLSPMGQNCIPAVPNNFRPFPVLQSSIASPSKMLLAVDSVWERDRSTGVPRGGGNWCVDPPARRMASGEDTLPSIAGCTSRQFFGGWNPSFPNFWNVYGGSWPWHKNNTVVVSYVDGHVGIISIERLGAGATILDEWGGRIYDRELYLWDSQ